MALPSSENLGDVSLLGDIGSTFIKLVAIGGDGVPIRRLKLPTTHDDIAQGVERSHAALAATLAIDRPPPVLSSSSAGGGLRILVLGFERELTLGAALRASTTAGGRIVGMYTERELAAETHAGLLARSPDLVLLTGGTDGGDRESILRAARRLMDLAPQLPVVVAGNVESRSEVCRVLGNGRPVEFASNVMPQVGVLDIDDTQRAIRRLFLTHVIGHGRFQSASRVAATIRMPTPAAVLAGTGTVAARATGNPDLARPVVIDIGGATTDVHSALPAENSARGYGSTGLPDQALTRTVEGDLGLRENAEGLVEAAAREDYLEPGEQEGLEVAARRRSADIAFVPAGKLDARTDERLAELAGAIALHRHAGVMQTTLTPAGAVLRRTGRDLREATCLIVTGGVFQHSPRWATMAANVLRLARGRAALIPDRLPVFRDRLYLLWAAGLMADDSPEKSAAIVGATLQAAGEA